MIFSGFIDEMPGLKYILNYIFSRRKLLKQHNKACKNVVRSLDVLVSTSEACCNTRNLHVYLLLLFTKMSVFMTLRSKEKEIEIDGEGGCDGCGNGKAY